MRRLTIVLTAFLLVVLMCPAAYADSDCFYCKYKPKAERGTLFYVEIYSKEEISAAVAELSVNSNYADFRSVTAEDSDDSVRSSQEGSIIRVAFASEKAKSGILFRVGFKALSAGKCDFVLNVDSAADGEQSLLQGFSPYTLSVSLGKDDVASSGKSAKSGSSSKSGASSRSGKLSEISGADNDDEYAERYGAEVTDLRSTPTLTYILLGAGGAVLLGLIALLTVLLIKRRRAAAAKNIPESVENEQTLGPEADDIEDSYTDDEASQAQEEAENEDL